MLAAASIVPQGIKHHNEVLFLHPDPTGQQHEECKAGKWQRDSLELPADKATGMSVTTMHKSVYARFAASAVLQYDALGPYRPENMRKHHDDFAHYYGDGTARDPQTLTDNIEVKWEQQ